MTYYLQRPAMADLQPLVTARSNAPYTYAELGATRPPSSYPSGYYAHEVQQQLGRGAETFSRAKAALRQWRQYETGWTTVISPLPAIEQGQPVGVLARILGIWSLNVCRIVYVIDEPRQFGFGYGTVAQHAEAGEELFLVEHREEDDAVWYTVRAFFRPMQWPVRLGWPYLRHVVDRFREQSAQAMERAAK